MSHVLSGTAECDLRDSILSNTDPRLGRSPSLGFVFGAAAGLGMLLWL